VVPISYLFEGDAIYVHSMPGRKIKMLRANPRACLQVDDIKSTYDWKSVLAFGNFAEVTDKVERGHLLVRLFNHFPHLTPVESRMEGNVEQAIVFRIEIDSISGIYEKW
jgi:nitroimidazol reductase NimA-like FMN-containing flavoprotein (pyridoxamine 5'-phosphate oxidase superfamily)